MNKKNYVIIWLFATLLLAWCGTATQTTEPTPTESWNVVIESTWEVATVQEPVQTWATTISWYTLGDVALHSTQKDCRTAVDGKVYDITKAFGKHKGWDEALLPLCGTNWSASFGKQHGENEKAKWFLTTLYIGDLR